MQSTPSRTTILIRSLLVALCLVLPATASGKGTSIVDLTFEGNKRITSIELHKWTSDLEVGTKTTVIYAKEVKEVLLQRYKEAGYPHARVWTDIKKGGHDVTIAIDEGEIHRIVLIGVDALDAVFYRVDLHLPDRVFHTPTYKKALDVLRRKYKLPGIYGEVRNNPLRMTRNPLGESITERELIVTIVKKQRFGWGFNLAFNPRWGILPGVSTRSRSTFLRGDTLTTQARIAIPYRQYLIQEEPEVQWVHGIVGADYLFPFWGQTRLAPGLEIKSELSRYSRQDLDVRFVLTSRTESFFRLEFVPTPYTNLGLAFGVDVIGNLALDGAGDLEGTPGVYPAAPVRRYVTRPKFRFDLTPDVLRTDHRTSITLTPKISVNEESRWLVDLDAQGHYVNLFFDNEFRVDTRLVHLDGAVEFWDERYLSGSFLKIHFPDTYWVREAAQLSLATRWGLGTDTAQIGFFGDVSLFGNRVPDQTTAGLAGGGGPSFHTLFFESLLLDVYYGVGHSPSGFGQSLTFYLRKVL